MNKEKITRNWLRRYTGTDPDDFGDWILITNFQNYVDKFAEKFDVYVKGKSGAMTSATNNEGLR